MNQSVIKFYEFSQSGIAALGADSQEANWPVVYQIYNGASIYIGETTNLRNRMSQHIQNEEKVSLDKFSVVFDDTYNKSVALDLESQLIQWFSGDGKYEILNKNDGLADHDYFEREKYRQQFTDIWERLRTLHLADKTVKEIENSGLFKFSPYKRLNENQLQVVNAVLADLANAFRNDQSSVSVVGGDEGTGKTIVLMYLVKLIRDIQDYDSKADETADIDQDSSVFSNNLLREQFQDKTMAMVIPSQSLKGSIEKIFKGISNMSSIDVLSPIDFGKSNKTYDITFVDEAHLLKISNQEVHKANRERVDAINEALFHDGQSHTELDWIIKKSRNVIMVYGDQRIRPNNITKQDIQSYQVREHLLKSQVRSRGGELYIDYLKSILSDVPSREKQRFETFEFKLYEDFRQFVDTVKSKEQEVGLSRLVAGFAWDWASRKDNKAYDIVIDGIGLQWNSTLNDWVGSPKSVDEVGSIYTIQGYDLRYCGVIIGNDLKYDPIAGKLVLDRKNYFDRGAKKRNKLQIESDTQLTDADLLDQVIRTYRILMNRSIEGTYVYVCDANLRSYLSQFIDTIS